VFFVHENSIKELEQLKANIKNEREQIEYFDDNGKLLDNIEFGDFTYGFPTILSWGEDTKLTIGKFCSISGNVTIFLGGEHRNDWVSTYPFNALLENYAYIKGHPKSKGNVIIGNDVWIGREAVILSGVSIGDGAVIGARSLVTKDVEPYSIVGGNPAKFIRYRFKKEFVDALLDIKWWDKELDEIAEIIPLLQSENVSEIIKRSSAEKGQISNSFNKIKFKNRFWKIDR
jgi:acetyltransferase-like isoleucine patch superfamily enzyme